MLGMSSSFGIGGSGVGETAADELAAGDALGACEALAVVTGEGLVEAGDGGVDGCARGKPQPASTRHSAAAERNLSTLIGRFPAAKRASGMPNVVPTIVAHCK